MVTDEELLRLPLLVVTAMEYRHPEVSPWKVHSVASLERSL